MVTPNAFIRHSALLRVLPVVPNPGMERPMIPHGFSCSLSNTLLHISNASVESNPPETPITTWSIPVCTSRLASPIA